MELSLKKLKLLPVYFSFRVVKSLYVRARYFSFRDLSFSFLFYIDRAYPLEKVFFDAT